MAHLKEHMLHDIFFDLLRRPYAMHIFRNSIFPGIGNFVLSGKGPFRVFRQIVADDFAITSISPDKLLVSYRGKSWRNGQRFLNTLFAKWTRKVGTMSLYWFTEVRTGYVQILAENHDVEAIGIYYTDCVNWIEVLKSFPNLVSLGLTREQFTDMIAAATELKIKLDNLDTVALSDRCSEGNLFDTLKIWHESISNCPNIEHMRWTSGFNSMTKFQFPESEMKFPSMKHLDINITEECKRRLDLSFLTAVDKMFPSLAKIHLVFEQNCVCSSQNIDRKLQVIDQFYKTFQFLNFGFALGVTYTEHFKKKDLNKVRAFFTSKGSVKRRNSDLGWDSLTVTKIYHKKRLTYVAKLEDEDE